ncbi:putative HTH-type transcriptional regulator [Pseudomonas fluorescens]|uniref:LysR family transcriptional regulator ArgP n=1 Tax=Pseudomonas fluorescens TaxID=294 RepID=UPI00123EF21C|nr:LysR family transcriptional regulator ArgP [Pseudomonas fluorescens]VVM54630.1 putative HTH-type transcriptional regulator [Pseudomonas fluorescens]
MFDYKLLAALAAVIEQGGFERAAQVLGLSQWRVSRGRQLRGEGVVEPVVGGGSEARPTEVGRQHVNHVQQVRLLGRDLLRQVPAVDEGGMPERLRIALNADSLATWWAGAVGAFCAEQPVLLDLVVEDQDVGLKRMRAGEVAACLCGSERPVAGARSQPLGAMRYRALASPAFMARHFPQGFDASRLARTPAIVFGPDDFLQHRYLASLGIADGFLHHLCPSSEGFLRMTEAGLGWGLVPERQVTAQLQCGELVEICADTPIDVPLYWHHWRNGGQLLAQLTEHLRQMAPGWLVPL